MIVKILKPTTRFSGVNYSQKKIDEGKASFSGAFNFPFNENKVSHETYIAYLERIANCISGRNTIKNRQFHAIISTKGKVHDEVFLVDITQRWMQKMGYGEQPYLIYFHGDTANNHVHIVSSRITKEGKIINAYNEGIRGVKFLNDLMKKDLKEAASIDIKDVLTNYSFSTEAQFKLILEQRGWKIREKNDRYMLFKNEICGDVAKSKVTEKAKKYKQNDARINQLRAIFSKYSGLPTEQFQNFMRTNFGVEVIFHKNRGHEKPYGYSVIDYDKKCVMKGGEILPLEMLLNSKSREEHLGIVMDILQNYATEKKTYSSLKSVFSRNGYYLKKKSIYQKGDDAYLLQLQQQLYKKLLYNDRLQEANKFIIHSQEEAKAISRLLYIRANDIILRPEIVRDDNSFREMVQSFSDDKEAMLEYFNEKNLKVIRYVDTTLLVDTKNYVIADVSGLGLEEESLNLERSSGHSRLNIEDSTDLYVTISIISSFIQLFDVPYTPEHDQNYLHRKRRRKRKII